MTSTSLSLYGSFLLCRFECHYYRTLLMTNDLSIQPTTNPSSVAGLAVSQSVLFCFAVLSAVYLCLQTLRTQTVSRLTHYYKPPSGTLGPCVTIIITGTPRTAYYLPVTVSTIIQSLQKNQGKRHRIPRFEENLLCSTKRPAFQSSCRRLL